MLFGGSKSNGRSMTSISPVAVTCVSIPTTSSLPILSRQRIVARPDLWGALILGNRSTFTSPSGVAWRAGVVLWLAILVGGCAVASADPPAAGDAAVEAKHALVVASRADGGREDATAAKDDRAYSSEDSAVRGTDASSPDAADGGSPDAADGGSPDAADGGSPDAADGAAMDSVASGCDGDTSTAAATDAAFTLSAPRGLLAFLAIFLFAGLDIILWCSLNSAYQLRDKWTDTQTGKTGNHEIRQAAALLALAVAFELTALLVLLQPGRRWQDVVALLPFLIVFYHAQALWVDTPGSPEDPSAPDDARQRVNKRLESYYSWQTIFLRYVVPAALVALAGLVAIDFAQSPPPFLSKYLRKGAFSYGLFGAFVFVYLELGRRAVRNDITPVSVLWSLTTLIVGPPLAAILPYAFAGSKDSAGLWNEEVVWILAGYLPKLVFGKLISVATKVLQADTSSMQEILQIPLSRISGIGADEAARLAEEGITAVHGLACVEPLRLMRDTRFDNWQIISWVDQALLISTIPDAVCRALVTFGYQGATDATSLLSPQGCGAEQSTMEAIERVTKVQPSEIEAMLRRLSNDVRTQDLVALIELFGRPRRGIDKVEPPRATAGAQVVIRGVGFGGEKAGILLGQVVAHGTDVTHWEDNRITLKVPDGCPLGKTTITVNPIKKTAIAVSGALFEVVHVTVKPSQAAVGIEVTIRIRGGGFGAEKRGICFGQVVADGTSVTHWEDNCITVKVPDGCPLGKTAITVDPIQKPAIALAETLFEVQ